MESLGVRELPAVPIVNEHDTSVAKERGLADETEVERRIAELSALDSVKYAVARRAAASELKIPVGTLDRLVKDRRPREDRAQGRPIEFPVVDPWPEPVNGETLLHDLVAALRRYVVLTNAQADAVVLWVLFTHVHDAFDVSPRLVVKSPQKRSGKTTLFAGLSRLVAKPRDTSAVTASALLRLIELHHPTVLIDETDALMAADKEMAQALRGLINSGFNRSFASCVMNVPIKDGGYEPRAFSTWAPLALAGIGHLPDTVRDRSIEIEMKRKLPAETVKKLRRRDGADLDELARKLARWAVDNLEVLRQAEPEMPNGLNDRAADAWEPLVAIADLAGGEWPSRARMAAPALSGEDVAAERDENVDTMLLADIRAAFDNSGGDKISGEDLTNYLAALEARPWAEWRSGKPISKHQLSKRLKEYGIVSNTIRTAEGTPRGYHRSAFDDAFARYLPGPPASTRNTATSLEKQEENGSFELATRPACGESKNYEIASNSVGCGDVASSRHCTEGESVLDRGGGARPSEIRL